MKTLCVLQGVIVSQDTSGRVHFVADADIDADGANGQSLVNGVPQFAYAPHNKGLDDTRNAGYPNGSWTNVLVPDIDGHHPMILLNNGHEGYCSTTTYQRRGLSIEDPDRYLDSFTVPYIVVEGFIRNRARGIVLGCKARVTYKGKSVDAVVGDMGPLYRIGELSIAAASAVGINPNPRTGGEDRFIVTYELWPGAPAVVNGVTYELIPA